MYGCFLLITIILILIFKNKILLKIKMQTLFKLLNIIPAITNNTLTHSYVQIYELLELNFKIYIPCLIIKAGHTYELHAS